MIGIRVRILMRIAEIMFTLPDTIGLYVSPVASLIANFMDLSRLKKKLKLQPKNT
jgi:hypothetical protein